jgi:hypothetical protein
VLTLSDAEPPGVRPVDLQSEHRSSTSSLEVRGADGLRREGGDRSGGERARSERSRAHGLTPQQVFTWRQQAVGKPGAKTAGATDPTFAMVAVDGVEAGGIVELVIAGVTLGIDPAVPAARVKEILQAVRSA